MERKEKRDDAVNVPLDVSSNWVGLVVIVAVAVVLVIDPFIRQSAECIILKEESALYYVTPMGMLPLF